MSTWSLIPQGDAAGVAPADARPHVDERGDVNYDSTVEEWLEAWPIHCLPAQPSRGATYVGEALHGLCVVGGLSALLIFLTDAAVGEERKHGGERPWSVAAWWLIRLWATTAAVCTLYILFGRADVIKRSPQTCYPIPPEVKARLRASQPLSGMANIEDSEGVPAGSKRQKLGSYCVRCCVWRQPDSKAHHCSVCERCVANFDHHCGVFGRCIVDGNMICFYGNIAMLMLGVLTTVFTMSMLS
eukprot:CAMPEP_0178380088 /NCGR_PEP_ID=MMETSP0689_2-20121128/5279_1 /TAXON_ID=160604 /ORGANISM="Amphidinium massartii, Strain CS-259" /LENGTH=242 /DNA_ID=CAMNT_0020000213 /DNA_START=111 /DNA_END=839 /DNA_ORIENTATION=+